MILQDGMEWKGKKSMGCDNNTPRWSYENPMRSESGNSSTSTNSLTRSLNVIFFPDGFSRIMSFAVKS
jgi:hypothetical protein